jgi:Na+-transporting NADH:ubiquinone oxidoreductase subunit A
MADVIIKKGLDVPIAGAPEAALEPAPHCRRVGIIAADYVGMKPTMAVAAGDKVKRGQLLFEDKKIPGVRFTAPGAGTVVEVNRGAKRAFQSVVVELTDSEGAGKPGDDELAAFESWSGNSIAGYSREQVKALLLESGLWTSLRARPFSRTANPAASPHSIFVTAIDTNPLAPPVEAALDGRQKEFETGLIAVSKLTDGKVYLCKRPNSVQAPPHTGIQQQDFAGPHPAGNVGTHIHFLDPVGRNKTVWHIGYQDVIAIGALVMTGKLDVARIVSLAGPGVKRPRLLRTRLGASLDDITHGQLCDGELRVISGSVLSGRTAMGDILGYLGRYHNQVSVIAEDRRRELLGWLAPGFGLYSFTNTFLSSLFLGRKFKFTSSQRGGRRAIVPMGTYEKVMPLDIQATYLLRALASDDLERIEMLGGLELDEEDLALCTFVSPSKQDYGPMLRRNLDTLEREG